jgi:hypothetical protein
LEGGRRKGKAKAKEARGRRVVTRRDEEGRRRKKRQEVGRRGKEGNGGETREKKKGMEEKGARRITLLGIKVAMVMLRSGNREVQLEFGVGTQSQPQRSRRKGKRRGRRGGEENEAQ